MPVGVKLYSTRFLFVIYKKIKFIRLKVPARRQNRGAGLLQKFMSVTYYFFVSGNVDNEKD